MSERPSTLDACTVAIVGLGLMGGSLGLALAGRCARRIGVDIDESAAAAAVAAGAIDEYAPRAEAVGRADIVVLAMPVRQIVQQASGVASEMRDGSVLTDLGSTKGAVCDAFDAIDERIEALGGHPMCGREVSGVEHADAGLFRGARWVLTPTARTAPRARTLIVELVEATGARAVDLDPGMHDLAVAHVSHMPYVLAQALVATLATADDRTGDVASTLAATGFGSASRLAGGDVQMWTDILATNAGYVRAALMPVQVELARLADALDHPAQLEVLLHAGRSALEHLGRRRD